MEYITQCDSVESKQSLNWETCILIWSGHFELRPETIKQIVTECYSCWLLIVAVRVYEPQLLHLHNEKVCYRLCKDLLQF